MDQEKKKGIENALTLVIISVIWQYSLASRLCCIAEIKSLLSGKMFLNYGKSKPVREMNGSKQPDVKLRC